MTPTRQQSGDILELPLSHLLAPQLKVDRRQLRRQQLHVNEFRPCFMIMQSDITPLLRIESLGNLFRYDPHKVFTDMHLHCMTHAINE